MVLQLKLHNSATGFFGVSMHVCELQLVHSEWRGSTRTTPSSHLAYKDIMFRFHAVDDGRETLAQVKSALRRLVAMRLPCSTSSSKTKAWTLRAHACKVTSPQECVRGSRGGNTQ